MPAPMRHSLLDCNINLISETGYVIPIKARQTTSLSMPMSHEAMNIMMTPRKLVAKGRMAEGANDRAPSYQPITPQPSLMSPLNSSWESSHWLNVIPAHPSIFFAHECESND